MALSYMYGICMFVQGQGLMIQERIDIWYVLWCMYVCAVHMVQTHTHTHGLGTIEWQIICSLLPWGIAPELPAGYAYKYVSGANIYAQSRDDIYVVYTSSSTNLGLHTESYQKTKKLPAWIIQSISRLNQAIPLTQRWCSKHPFSPATPTASK